MGRGMNKKLTIMPGVSCEFYVRGCCLRQERLNPGYHRVWRCEYIKRLEEEYDSFVSQADAFNLTQTLAARIWSARLQGLMSGQPICRSFKSKDPATDLAGPSGEEEYLDCVYYYQELCLTALPPCDGVCQEFKKKIFKK